MGVEIERKFLIADESWRTAASRHQRLRQGYLANSTTASVRVRIDGARAWLNIKGATLTAKRAEFDYEIPHADGEELLARLTTAEPIDKTRHWVPHAGHEWEIDEFHGANQGLIVAEIELGDEAEPFARPAWLGPEVTQLARYYNVNLVRHPYRSWSAEERGQ
jgi:adenylate cyclase